MIEIGSIDIKNVDIHKRVIITRQELEFLRVNNPGGVTIIPLPGGKNYEIVVSEVRSSFDRGPVSGKLFYFVFKGKEVGELEETRKGVVKEAAKEEKIEVSANKKPVAVKKVGTKILGKKSKKK